jgi:hypothetical protein
MFLEVAVTFPGVPESQRPLEDCQEDTIQAARSTVSGQVEGVGSPLQNVKGRREIRSLPDHPLRISAIQEEGLVVEEVLSIGVLGLEVLVAAPED